MPLVLLAKVEVTLAERLFRLEMTRTALFVQSAMNSRLPEGSKARPDGKFNCATVAVTPSA